MYTPTVHHCIYAIINMAIHTRNVYTYSTSLYICYYKYGHTYTQCIHLQYITVYMSTEGGIL